MANAKKSSSKRSRSSAKNQPAVRYLRYELTNSSNANTETSHFIDLARDLSAVNRRLMRQGRHYHVKRMTIVSSNTPNVGYTDPTTLISGARVSVSTIPESWVTIGAWKRGFSLFNQMHKRANAAVAGDIRGKWADFKVNMTTDFRTATKLVPKDNGGNLALLGEWNYTTFVTPDGTTSADEFELQMLGDHTGSVGGRASVGLVRSYGESRATVGTDPSVPTAVANDPLTNMFDDGTVHDEVITITFAEGDEPPYQIEQYPGDETNMSKPIVVQDGTLSDGRLTLGGFSAMCGMLEIESKSPVANDVFSVLVEMASGPYRGIKADVI
jgi:hypothetical protein